MKKINKSIQSVKAFAPATCANVAVGFDILGFAVDSVGDYVTVTKREDKKIIIEFIEAVEPLPFNSYKNTASVVIHKFCEALNLEIGFSISIKKGIPVSSGLGGSAASAVAALVACNNFLTAPLSTLELANFAVIGEQVSSGQPHADNIVPCLFGGLTLIHSQQPLKVINLPSPNLYCVLIYPHLQVPTRLARKVLKKTAPLAKYIQQSANLATFITSLYTNDHNLLKNALNDVLIEPQRAQFVPQFYRIKEAALQNGALGASFSGSGPTLFALTKTKKEAQKVAESMQLVLQENNIASNYWLSRINKTGALPVEINSCAI
ncbi:homoserine kinase [Legionella sp. D16C41]|uniref:homoserine kinase n=1 Tax=Legionella sp. D16C41 TaxID=3402688 RepID=UPI003AF8A0BA